MSSNFHSIIGFRTVSKFHLRKHIWKASVTKSQDVCEQQCKNKSEAIPAASTFDVMGSYHSPHKNWKLQSDLAEASE